MALGLAANAAVADDGLISEIRAGASAHDEGAFSDMKESGIDVNGEILFGDTGWFGENWQLRPNIGMNINTRGETNQGYLGMVATRRIFGFIFVELGVGGALHDGKLDTTDPDRRSLGCRVLFHIQGDIGVELGEHWRLMAHADHMSNANLCDRNEGLETAGVRLGYRF
jgi:lipid A 3-O-deacylase